MARLSTDDPDWNTAGLGGPSMDGSSYEWQRELAAHRSAFFNCRAIFHAVDKVPASMTIREVADRSGCSASALRYYEAQGLITPLPRGAAYARRYDPQVLAALEVITALRGAGFGICEIRAFMAVKQTGVDVQQKLTNALKAIETLSAAIAERRAALDRASELLCDWQQEIKGFRGDQGP